MTNECTATIKRACVCAAMVSTIIPYHKNNQLMTAITALEINYLLFYFVCVSGYYLHYDIPRNVRNTNKIEKKCFLFLF